MGGWGLGFWGDGDGGTWTKVGLDFDSLVVGWLVGWEFSCGR